MPPRSAPPESKRGLIITLVFFILMTLGLGVSTYFGIEGQDAKEKAKTKAEADKSQMEKDRDAYKFASMYYRAAMGQDENMDHSFLGTRKEQFDQGGLKELPEDDKKLIKELDQRFKWNGKENKPGLTYEKQYADLKSAYDALAKKNDDLQQNLTTTQKALKTAKDNLASASTEFEANLGKLKEQNTKDQETNHKTIEGIRADMERISKENAEALNKVDADRKRLSNEVASKNSEISQFQKRVSANESELSQYRLKGTDAPPSLKTDWKIISMDRRGNEPYINLGEADHVKTQLTFSIHGVGVDGRPISKAKGTLEVVHVLRDHLSQARITSVKDPDRDPILVGDVLYNPSWDPQQKKHVALAGFMDVTGDGRNGVLEFKRNLERQNIIVDAWLDPKDFSPKGKGMTVRTDFLVVSEYQDFGQTGRGMGAEEQKNLNAAIQKMKEQASKNGVTVVRLSKYLEMIGYRVPRRAADERPSMFDPGLHPDLTPPPIYRPPTTPPNK